MIATLFDRDPELVNRTADATIPVRWCSTWHNATTSSTGYQGVKTQPDKGDRVMKA